MELCVSCGESYESDRTECPFCGCPRGWIQIPEGTLTEEETRKYSLIGVKKTEGPGPAYVIWDDEEQKKKLLLVLPRGDDGYCHYIDLKTILSSPLQKKAEYFPEILVLKWDEGTDSGYYICALDEGVTLREALEREKPLNPELGERLSRNRKQLVKQMAKLVRKPIENCRLEPESVLFTEDGRVMEMNYEFLYGSLYENDNLEKTMPIMAKEGGAVRQPKKESLAELLKRRLFGRK